MSADEVIRILQLGFSGFAFLMAALSYRLLLAESGRSEKPRAEMLTAIRRYTNYTLLLEVLVLLSSFAERTIDWVFWLRRDQGPRLTVIRPI